MKTLLALILLASSAFATTTVTGHITQLNSSTPGTSSFVRFWLRGCRGNQPRVTGTGAIAPQFNGTSFYVDLPADASGNVSGTLYSTRDAAGTGNGEIECGGSYTAVWYGMQIFNNNVAGPEVPIHAKNGVSFDISNVTPTSTSPVITAPTGDTTYCRIDGGNCGFTGPITGPQGTFSQLQGCQWVDALQSFAAALSAVGSSGCIGVTPGTWAVSVSATIPSTVMLVSLGGVLSIATTKTLTANGPILAPDTAQLFSLSGTAVVAGLAVSRPEWFGGTASANVLAAYNALASGGKLALRSATYVSPWISLATEIQKSNIEIAGSGAPQYNSQTAPTALTGGTIIQGPVWIDTRPAGSPANKLYIHDLGIDVGSAVCTALFSGVAQQGLFFNNNFPSGSTIGPPFLESPIVQNVVTLAQSNVAAIHSVLCDNCRNGSFANLTTFFGIYGLVIKGPGNVVNGLYGRGHNSYGLYLKSDALFGEADNNRISNVLVEKAASNNDSGCVEVESQGANNVSFNSINNLICRNTSLGIGFAGTTGQVNNFTLSNFQFDTINGQAIFIGGAGGTNRISIANGVINTTGSDAIQIASTATNTAISNVQIENITGNGLNNNGSLSIFSNINFNQTSACGLTLPGGTAHWTGITGQSNTSGLFCGATPAVSSCGTSPAISGTNSNFIVSTGSGTVTSCTVTFAATNPFGAAPACQPSTSSTGVTADVSAISSTAVTFSFSATLTSGQVYAHCGQATQ